MKNQVSRFNYREAHDYQLLSYQPLIHRNPVTFAVILERVAKGF